MKAERAYAKHRRESERPATAEELEVMRAYLQQEELRTGLKISDWEAIRGTDATASKRHAPTKVRETMDRLLRTERRKEAERSRDPRIRRSDLHFDNQPGIRYF